jgi:lysophospholipase L1-like esterase
MGLRFGMSRPVLSSLVRAALLLALVLTAGCSDPPAAPTPPPPPSLTCPANVAVGSVTGGSLAVTYDTPTLSGGAPPVTTVCQPASGTSFSPGTTTVTCTATDARSRQAACSFTVTLTALTLSVQRFTAFGDSVTAGEDGRRAQVRRGFIDPVRAYPAVLQSLLRAEYPGQEITVTNDGEGGRRATDDVDRLPGVLQARNPEVLLLLHGYNDLLAGGRSAVDPVVSAVRSMVRTAHAAAVRHVFVSTLTPSRPATGPFNRAIDLRAIEEVNGRLLQMAAAEGAHVVNAFEAFLGREAELIDEDGLHLTAAGNQRLAETFYSSIRAAGLATGSRQAGR